MFEVEGVPVSLPDFVTELRPHQEQAMAEIVSLFKTRNVVFLDAPTGAGKTIIGEGVRQVMRSGQHGFHHQALYLCTTKSLQEQFLHDFPYAKLIKGRSNYPTFDSPEAFKLFGSRRLDASVCNKKRIPAADVPVCSQCEISIPDYDYNNERPQHELEELKVSHCHNCHPWQNCPYEVAKNQALASPLTVANTSYLLTEANYVGRFGAKSDFTLMVVDEADTVESVLMNFVEVSIGKRYIKEYGLGLPDKVTKPSSWLEWAERSLQRLQNLALNSGVQLSLYDNEPPPLDVKRKSEQLQRHAQTLDYAIKSLQREPENWVLDDYQDGAVRLKPVTVASHARPLLWNHAKKFLLMSATMVSPDQVATDLGLTEHEWGSVIVDSNFPPERRPVYVQSRANMTAKTKDEAYPLMVKAVAEILDKHRGERILVHTHSYEWTNHLYNALRSSNQFDRIVTYDNAGDRDNVLETYKNRPNAVLLAPSLDRGIDLADDLCRVIIITKVPFPYLGDKQVNKRFFGMGQAGKNWYYTETIRSIVQMTGRGMRHRNDSCITYILDAQFKTNLWATPAARHRIPKWWTEALVWEAPRRR